MILGFARSDKLKVAANALRALSFFLAEADLRLLDDGGLPAQIREIVLMQLANKSPKVSWNACIVIAKTIKNKCDDSPTKQMFFSENTVALLLDLVANKPNIKARIQAINALLNYTSIE